MTRLVRRFGESRPGIWYVKHVAAPLDVLLYRLTGGRLVSTGRPVGPLLLLTTTGRHSGRPRTNPIFYLADGDRLVICNVNPGFERPNPWTLNIRARPLVRVWVGAKVAAYRAREASEEEVARFWPRLVAIWPAYERFFERTGERSIFVLEPVADGGQAAGSRQSGGSTGAARR